MSDKLCKDCKHQIDNGKYSKCAVVSLPEERDLVTGGLKGGGPLYCSVVRSFSWGSCAKEGKLFEPKIHIVKSDLRDIDFGNGVILEHSDEPPQKKKSIFQKLIGR